MSDTITITIADPTTGQAESMTVSQEGTSVQNVLEFAQALLGGVNPATDRLLRDGKPLMNEKTLAQEQVQMNDMLVVQKQQSVPIGGGLDFSNLLTPASRGPPPAAAPQGGLDFSSLISGAPTAAPQTSNPDGFVYYPGMNLDEAIAYNPHPRSIVKLLFSKDHLWKELHYHNPKLGAIMQGVKNNLEEGERTWRQQIVQGSIQRAMTQTDNFHREQEMKERVRKNPEDQEAAAYFRRLENQKLVQQQYLQVMEEYPESLARVLMLYIPAKINGHELHAFCDSGAQMTVMSKKIATKCGILDFLDERFKGMASGVGTGKILGRVHLVHLQLDSPGGQYHFPCTITVMDDAAEGAKEMPFLLGLDMMRRHQCQLDLEKGVLRFRIPPSRHLEVPFLHEKDLDEAQGGTRGFDANLANAKMMEEDEEDQNAG